MTEKYKLNQVAIRMVKERPLLSTEEVNSPEVAIRVMSKLLQDYDREVLAVVNLQTDLRPINMNIVSIGTLNSSVASPREILKSVILSNAAAVMLIHNHPSGKIEPSREDINITMRMEKVLGLLDVNLLDHVIIGSEGRYYSFKENDTMTIERERNWNEIRSEKVKIEER